MKSEFRLLLDVGLADARDALMKINETRQAFAPKLVPEVYGSEFKLSSSFWRPTWLCSGVLTGTLEQNTRGTALNGKFSMNPFGKLLSGVMALVLLWIIWTDFRTRTGWWDVARDFLVLVVLLLPFLFEKLLIARDQQNIQNVIYEKFSGRILFDA